MSRRPTHLRRVFDQSRLDASVILSDGTLFMLVRYRGGGPYIVLDMAGCSSGDSPVYLQLTNGRAALPIEVCQSCLFHHQQTIPLPEAAGFVP